MVRRRWGVLVFLALLASGGTSAEEKPPTNGSSSAAAAETNAEEAISSVGGERAPGVVGNNSSSEVSKEDGNSAVRKSAPLVAEVGSFSEVTNEEDNSVVGKNSSGVAEYDSFSEVTNEDGNSAVRKSAPLVAEVGSFSEVTNEEGNSVVGKNSSGVAEYGSFSEVTNEEGNSVVGKNSSGVAENGSFSKVAKEESNAVVGKTAPRSTVEHSNSSEVVDKSASRISEEEGPAEFASEEGQSVAGKNVSKDKPYNGSYAVAAEGRTYTVGKNASTIVDDGSFSQVGPGEDNFIVENNASSLANNGSHKIRDSVVNRSASRVEGRSPSKIAVEEGTPVVGRRVGRMMGEGIPYEITIERTNDIVSGVVADKANRETFPEESISDVENNDLELPTGGVAEGTASFVGRSSPEARNLEDCWSAMDAACLGAASSRRLKELWRRDEVQLTDSLVLERLPPDGKGPTTAGGRAVSWDEGLGLDRLAANLEKVLASRAVRLQLWGDVGLRLVRSEAHPGYMEVALTVGKDPTDPPGEAQTTAKGHKMSKMLLPLLLGFKTAGAIVLAMAAVKVLLVKALLVSKLALLAALFLVLKKLLSLSAMSQHSQPSFLYSHYPLPYHEDYHHQYQYQQQPVGYLAYHHHAPSYGTSGAGFAPSSSAAGGDLQAHFSDVHVATAAPGGGNSTAAGARSDAAYQLPPHALRDADGYPPGPPPQRKSFSLVKSSANRVPVVTYLRVVSTGRKA